MAVDTVPVAVHGSGGPDIRSGRSSPSAEPGGGRCARAAAGADSPEPQSAQSSADRSPGSGGSGAVGAHSSGASASGNAPAKPDGSGGDSGPGKSAAPATSACAASAGKATAQPAADTDDFAAALAQSLAATPAANAGPPDPTTKASADSGASKPGAQPAKHSAADPLATALALLEHALAGVLAGAASAAPAAPNASAAAAGKSSPQSGPCGAATNAAATLDSQLMQTLAADAKAAASTPATAAGPPAPTTPAAAPAATPGAAAAALTATQLIAGPHIGLQQPKSDPTPMALSSPVGSGPWTEELGAKVTWMAHQGIESASLQLSPAHLGPLQVSISVHNGQASVWFGAAQPDTRTALQQSLPQLRQLFANQGLTLADAGVSRESPRGRSRQSPGRSAAPVSAVAAVTLDGSPGRATAAGGLGLLDTYA